jgi:ankyrin repeat protein
VIPNLENLKARLPLTNSTRFRWVQLSLQALKKKGSSEEVLKRLKQLPQKLEKLYAEIYKEILELDRKDFQKTYQTLVLLMYQHTRLHTLEVVEAVFKNYNTAQIPELASKLFGFASDFIEYDEYTDEWRLAHLSVKEYLESRPEYRMGPAHATIARLCLSHATGYFDISSSSTRRSWEIGHFICYALTQWPYHVWHAGSMRQQDKRLRKLLNGNNASAKLQPMDRWIETVVKALEHRNSSENKTDMSTPALNLTGSDEDASSSEEDQQESRGQEEFDPNPNFENATMTTCSNPPVPLFTYAQWRVEEVLENSSSIPKEAWDTIRNSHGRTVAEEICNWSDLASMTQVLDLLPPLTLSAILETSTPMSEVIVHGPIKDQEAMMLALLDRGFCNETAAVHLAAIHRKPAILKFLIDRGSMINAKDERGSTPLHLLFKPQWSMSLSEAEFEDEEQLHCIRILLDAGADVHCENASGKEPIQLAVEGSSAAAVQLLLQKGANVNPKSEAGSCLILRALIYRRKKLVEVLLEAGADPNGKDSKGQSALHQAILFGDQGIIKLLILKGADPMAKNEQGESMVHLAVVSRDAQNDAVARIFLELGVDINCRTRDGLTPLHMVARVGTGKEVVELLLSKGADVHAADNNGMTPLHVAARNGRDTSMLEAMIQHGANVNAMATDKTTPLYHAVWLTCAGRWADEALAACRLLLDAGADLFAVAATGLSIIEVLIFSDFDNPLIFEPAEIARVKALRVDLRQLCLGRIPLALPSLRDDITNSIPEEIKRLPLPTGWEERRTQDDFLYFIDHNERKTTWADPRVQRPFPEEGELRVKQERYDICMLDWRLLKMLEALSIGQAPATEGGSV